VSKPRRGGRDSTEGSRRPHPHAPGGPATPHAGHTPPAGNPRPILLAALIVVAAGVALRLWHVGAGLPDFLDEAIPWKNAFRMWVDERRVDLNPHFFNYPTLTIYLCLILQKSAYALGHLFGFYSNAADFLMDYELDPSALVIAARTMGVAFEVLTIVMVVRIGERQRRWAGVIAAAVVALSPTMIATSRAIYTDTYMTAFALWALERMLAYRAERKTSQLAAAAVLTGLAVGSKYPAVVLVIPLAWVLIERRGWKGLLPWALACAAAAGVFFITTPYALLDVRKFIADVGFERFHMASGHLGSEGRRGFLFQLQALTADLGWIGLALLLVSLGATLAAPRRNGERVALWLFLLPVGLAISLARVEAGRYLVPVVPVAAALAAVAALDLARRFGARAPALATGLAALALVAPLAPGGIAAGTQGGDDTQAQARRWCEANVADTMLILRESYTGNLYTRQRDANVQRTRGFRTASPERQARLRARRVFDVAELPLIAAGETSMLLYHRDGRSQRIQVFEKPGDINQIFYDLRLLHGVDVVMTSAAARGRFEADSARYRSQKTFYRFLDDFAEHVASFRAGHGVSGPGVDIYQIGDRARAAIVRVGPLHALWWAQYVPPSFRTEFEELAVEPGLRSGGALVQADGVIAPWIGGLSSFFDKDVRPFARLLAWELEHMSRFVAAQPLYESILVMHPEETEACLAYARCAAAQERWMGVATATSNTLGALPRGQAAPAELYYLRGLSLGRLGQREDGLADLERARTLAAPGSDLRAAAEAEARRLSAARR
jgi:hypothetical protein